MGGRCQNGDDWSGFAAESAMCCMEVGTLLGAASGHCLDRVGDLTSAATRADAACSTCAGSAACALLEGVCVLLLALPRPRPVRPPRLPAMPPRTRSLAA